MKMTVLKIISYLALAGTIIPSLLVFFGDMDIEGSKNVMAVSMVVWFVSAPFWINKKADDEVLD
jgi:hypothetical protein